MSGWLLVMHAYLCHFLLSPYCTRFHAACFSKSIILLYIFAFLTPLHFVIYVRVVVRFYANKTTSNFITIKAACKALRLFFDPAVTLNRFFSVTFFTKVKSTSVNN